MDHNDGTSLAGRIRQIIRDSGLSLPRFAHLAGVAKNTLVNYRDGVTLPTADFLETICREFRVRPEWLLLGQGQVYIEPSRQSGSRGGAAAHNVGGTDRLDPDSYCMVPLLESRVTGGPEGELLYEEVSDQYPFKRWWLERLVGRNPDRLGNLVLIRVRGDSMSPTVNQGEMALVDTSEVERRQVITGRIYLVILPEGTVALKRLVLSREGDKVRLACLSDNTTAYRPFEFEIDPDKALPTYVLGRLRWAGKEFD